MDDRILRQLIEQIADVLVPALKLDAYEIALYYHLLRHSRLIDRKEVKVSTATLQSQLGFSANAIKSRLRSLREKGCITLVDTGWAGTSISLLLPNEIPACVRVETSKQELDIEAVDFFTDPKYRSAIFAHEKNSCFYCFKTLTPENYSLDHVVPQVGNRNNSYRNIVASCHSCDSAENDLAAGDYVRRLYRQGQLNEDELEGRLRAIEALAGGELRPEL